MPLRFSHRALCVSNLAASQEFYSVALGFEPIADDSLPQDLASNAAAELGAVKLRARRLRNAQQVVVQLLEFESPKASGPRERRPTNRYGLTHFAIYVDDVDAAAARVIAAGGKSHPHTRAIYPANNTEMMYCTDPDGVRVELMRAAGEAARFSHSGICVKDVAASARFYESIGFSLAENYELSDEPWLEVMNELPGAKLRAQMVRDAAGNTIELLYLYAPGCEGPREPAPLNRFGFNYLAFTTDDLDAAAAAIERAGGRALPSTRSRSDGYETLTCADPDGARLHLTRRVAS